MCVIHLNALVFWSCVFQEELYWVYLGLFVSILGTLARLAAAIEKGCHNEHGNKHENKTRRYNRNVQWLFNESRLIFTSEPAERELAAAWVLSVCLCWAGVAIQYRQSVSQFVPCASVAHVHNHSYPPPFCPIYPFIHTTQTHTPWCCLPMM